MNGWIKLHRKLLDWEWYDDANTLRLFIHLLLKSNSEQCKWHGITISRGDLFTSISNLANELKLTDKQIRLSLKKLILTNEIVTKGANNGTMITICKYEDYQTNDKSKGQTDGKQRANRGQTEGNKQEHKELKKIKEIEIPEFSEFKNFAITNQFNTNLHKLELKYKAWVEAGWVDGNGKKIINWKTKLLNSLEYMQDLSIRNPNTKTPLAMS